MDNEEVRTLLIDWVKEINEAYRKYYYGMTERGLPLEVDNFAGGLKKSLIERINLTFKQDKCDDCVYKKITECLKKVWGDPIK